MLAGVAARLAELGLTPVLALELEFYLIDRQRGEDGAPMPVASPVTGRREGQGQVLSLSKLDEYQPVLDEMERAAKAQGLPITTMISEYGAGPGHAGAGSNPARCRCS